MTPPRTATPRKPEANARGATARAASPRKAAQRATAQRTPAQRTTSPRTATRPTAPARGADRPKTLHARPASKPALRRSSARRRGRQGNGIAPGTQLRRLKAARAIILALLVILVARLVQLQGFESTKYAEQGQQKRLRKTTIFAQRGSILDRNGAALALSQESRTITVDPKIVKAAMTTKNAKNAKKPGDIAAALAPLLRMRAADIEPRLTGEGRYTILARGIDVPVAREIMALKLPGISYEPSTKRIYPNDALASVIGFVNSAGAGAGGIESAFEERLAGKNGRSVVEQSKSRVISSGVRKFDEPRPGGDVQLTIDRDVQWMAQRTLDSEVARTGSSGGHVIVMDVRSGELLALASNPTFNPNATGSADAAALGSITAVSNVYEPGSVMKLATVAAAVETGLYGPDSTIVVPPSITLGGKTFEEHGASGEQKLTLTGVVAKSSNVGTITIAQKLGKQTVYEFLKRFGLGQKTGVGLPGESKGLLAPVGQWSGSQVGNVPIGQGISVTALQMAQMYAIVANGGLKVTPTIVKDASAAPPATTRVISETSATAMRGMLEAVTGEGGTAQAARVDGYRIAGKTGTARRVREDGRGYEPGKYISSFIGFAPADKPEILVEVVLDRPSSGYYAGTVATPAFREVMAFALAARKVEPTPGTVRPARLVADSK